MKKLSNPTVFRINSLQVTFQRAARVDLPANHFLMAFKLWNGNFPTFIALDFIQIIMVPLNLERFHSESAIVPHLQ